MYIYLYIHIHIYSVTFLHHSILARWLAQYLLHSLAFIIPLLSLSPSLISVLCKRKYSIRTLNSITVLLINRKYPYFEG